MKANPGPEEQCTLHLLLHSDSIRPLCLRLTLYLSANLSLHTPSHSHTQTEGYSRFIFDLTRCQDPAGVMNAAASGDGRAAVSVVRDEPDCIMHKHLTKHAPASACGIQGTQLLGFRAQQMILLS